MKEHFFDPTLLDRIPKEVLEAERTLSHWFAEQGVREWKLGNAQNRIDSTSTLNAEDAARFRVLQERFAHMKTSASERALEAFDIEFDATESLAAAVDSVRKT